MLDEPGQLGMHLYRADDGGLRFTVYRLGEAMSLSAVLPVLQSMGVSVVDERPYQVMPRRQRRPPGSTTSASPRRTCSTATRSWTRCTARWRTRSRPRWRGESEVDGFNALVLRGGPRPGTRSWCCGPYAKYLRQAGTIYSQDYMERALVAHPDLARQLVDLFAARFDPGFDLRPGARRRAGRLAERITAALDEVASLDEDRILRGFLTLVLATLRTNYFQRGDDGRHKPYLSLKIDPQAVPELPMPRPKFEIFVYSPRLEGVHLRFGAVARGRPALVGPARGLPNRGPGPGQGADGEEHGDRAGRVQGRVRREAAAAPAATARRSWPRGSPATGRSSPACST